MTGDARLVTVFGGTGFLGRRVVQALRSRGRKVRAASRHPERSRRLFGADAGIEAVKTDIEHEPSVANALAGATGVVNAVSLYVERGRETFDAVHVVAARRLAEAARRSGVARLVQLSGIGADPASSSLYIRKRGVGELAVRAAFPEAIVVRPAVMFAADDRFLTTLVALLRRLPAYPLFGRGQTRLQPVAADDVAEAIARLFEAGAPATTHEFGGPRIFTYEELIRTIARAAGLRPVLIPFPFAGWHALARLSELVPGAPLARNQVELMEVDTVASPGVPGLADLGITAQSVEEALQSLLERERASR